MMRAAPIPAAGTAHVEAGPSHEQEIFRHHAKTTPTASVLLARRAILIHARWR